MITKVLAVAAVAILAVAQPGGCAPMSNPADLSGVCSFDLQPPVVVIHSSPAVQVEADAYCDHAPQTHRMTLAVTRTVDGRDHAMSDALGRLTHTCEDIPTPGKTVRCIWYLQPCLSGHYRVTVAVRGTGLRADGSTTTWDQSDVKSADLRCR